MRKYLLGAAIALAASPAFADAFDEYSNNGHVYEYDLPTISGGWGIVLAGFPAGSPTVGGYALSGRLLAANGSTLYLQKNYGSDVWVPVANIGSGTMDPSFLRISSDGSKIALGVGYNQDILVFPSSILSLTSPPNLTVHPSVDAFTADYYDGHFRGTNQLVINGGWVSGGIWRSAVYAINLTSGAQTLLIDDIPGASAGIAVDAAGNIVTGIGYQTSPNRTGEVKIWDTADIAAVLGGGTALDYDTTGELVAENILSATSFGFDHEGNLHVGGGDAFGVGGPSENGYAALVHSSVLANVLGGSGVPVNEGSTLEYTELVPDACQDDSATSPITFVGATEALAIAWNPTGNEFSSPPNACYAAGSANDYWTTGVTPKVTLYFPTGAPDDDGDGIPNGADNAYLTPNANQRDTDGDGWGNIADADFNNDGTVNLADRSIWLAANGSTVGQPAYNPHADMNGDGAVNSADWTLILGRWGQSPPYY